MGSHEALFLQMQPYLISHPKLVWYPMLIMVLLVLGIGFLQNVLNLLLDMLHSFNKFGLLDQP
jgi:ABC-type dipeptide/oligopeptide/nickel transport system permease subunit